MTKILNLDKIVTKRDKVIVLGGKEHVMKTLTVKEYIDQMKTGENLDTLMKEESVASLSKVFELTIDAISKIFPTIKREQFEALTLDQLTAIREFAEDASTEDAPEGEAAGEAAGKQE